MTNKPLKIRPEGDTEHSSHEGKVATPRLRTHRGAGAGQGDGRGPLTAMGTAEGHKMSLSPPHPREMGDVVRDRAALARPLVNCHLRFHI